MQAQLDRPARVLRREDGDGVAVEVARDARVEPDPHGPRSLPRAASRLGDGLVPHSEQLTHWRQQQLTGPAQRDRASIALEQRESKAPLEESQLLGERRLGDVQQLGCASEMELVGYRHEVAQVPQMRIHSGRLDRKSTRLNSSHLGISYAVFCLK